MSTALNLSLFLLGCVMTLVGSACADAGDGSEVEHSLTIDPDKRSNEDDAAAGNGLWAVRDFDTAVHEAIARVKSDEEAAPFAVYDAIREELAETTLSGAILEKAAEQVLEQMLVTEEDLHAANVYAFLMRIAELISLPREVIPEKRRARLWNDSFDMKSTVDLFARSDDADRKKRAYHFAAAYNVVLNAQVLVFALDDSPASSFANEYEEAIAINSRLVGAEEGDEGFLSAWIAEQTAGPASARVKNDTNVVVKTLRLAIEEQRRLIE